jgi:hypothetical protein
LGICADYFDVFLSIKLTLYDRVVLAAKVSFLYRIWHLWLKHGNHTMGGITKSLTQFGIFVFQQCFLDIQMFCPFVVLLIKMFKDQFPNMVVLLHLTCSTIVMFLLVELREWWGWKKLTISII